MGIDGLDLKYRLENRLGIRIEQAELFIAFHTVDTLYRCLVAKVRGGQQQIPDIETLWLEVSRDLSRLAGWWRLTTSDDLNKRFRPATRATRHRPYLPAIFAAAIESESGIRERGSRARRRSSNRRRMASNSVGRPCLLRVRIGCPPRICEPKPDGTTGFNVVYSRPLEGHPRSRRSWQSWFDCLS